VLIIEAVARLRARGIRVSYHIIGAGEEEGRLASRIAALGLQDCVHLQGPVANERLRPWYQAASLFVLASSREGWPNVLNEALACGTPVVATKVGGVPEIVRHGDNGLLMERSVEAIADALEAGLKRTWDRQALAQAASRTGWADVAERLVTIFSRVCGEKPRGAAGPFWKTPGPLPNPCPPLRSRDSFQDLADPVSDPDTAGLCDESKSRSGLHVLRAVGSAPGGLAVDTRGADCGSSAFSSWRLSAQRDRLTGRPPVAAPEPRHSTSAGRRRHPRPRFADRVATVHPAA